MSYRRWYDTDPRLSAVVRTMERLNRDSQLQFAQKLCDLSEELLAEYGGEVYLQELDPKRKDGLQKSKSKARWYDNHEKLHKAFNNLYALPAEDRNKIALQLETPIQIVSGYERYSAKNGMPLESRVVEEIVRSCFIQGTTRACKLYGLYLSTPQPTPQTRHPEVSESVWSQLLKQIQEALRS